MGVGESGYYRSLKDNPFPKKSELLLVKIEAIQTKHPDNKNYGVKRVHMALQQEGEKVSYSTVYRLMKENGMIHKVKRHPNGITKEDMAAEKSENLIKRDFKAGEPNKKWLTDITEVPCNNGKLYVASIMDCFNGEIVGLAMADHMRKELCIQAFESACRTRNARGMLLHSDRGSQFTSKGFRESLEKYGANQSVSGTGKCYDNARIESFFATLKKEKLYRIRTEHYSMEYVKTVIFRYIMIYYNRYRVYTANPGGLPPIMYRNRSVNRAQVA